MNNCNCKHASYCKVDSSKCKLDIGNKQPDNRIFGYTTKEIMAKQGRPGRDLS